MDISPDTLENAADHCPFCGNVVTLGAASYPAKDAPCPHCGELLWFVRKTTGDVVILTFLPGLMLGDESVLRVDEVSTAIGDLSGVVVNLTHLHFVTSTFLAMLVALHKRTAAAHGILKFCGLQRHTVEALTITKLDTLFDSYADEQSALASF